MILDLLLGQLRDVVVGPDEPVFFTAPEREANAVDRLDSQFGHLHGRLEDGGGAGSVVVDAGALRHAVEVSADDHGAVGASAGVSEHVEGLHRFDVRVECKRAW